MPPAISAIVIEYPQQLHRSICLADWLYVLTSRTKNVTAAVPAYNTAAAINTLCTPIKSAKAPIMAIVKTDHAVKIVFLAAVTGARSSSVNVS